MLRGPATEIFGRTVSLSGRLTLSVGAAPARSRIIITRTLAGSKSDHLLRIGLVNPNGELSVRYVPSYSTTFTVDFWGNSEYQAAIVKRIIYVRAGVGESISGYSATAYVGKTLYRVYQQTNTLAAASTVAPDGKGCVAFEIDEYADGAWQFDSISSCAKLNGSSKASMKFGLSSVPGGQFRIRADFRRASKDTTNVNADSGWSYFLVVS